jgi:hypothetical protein
MDNWDAYQHLPQERQQEFIPPQHPMPRTDLQLPHPFSGSSTPSHEWERDRRAENPPFPFDPYNSFLGEHSRVLQRHDTEGTSNVIARLDPWWMGFIAPKGYTSRIGLDVKESDRLRRGKLLARALTTLLIVCCLATIIIFVSFAEAPTLTWLIQLGAAFVFILILIALSQLNFHGHVEAAALLTALLLMAAILAGDLSTDLAVVHSYNWTDVPSWDLLIAPLILVSLTMHRWQAWLIFGLFVVIVVVVVLCVPQSPEVLSADLASGGVSHIGSALQQHLSLIIDLLWRSVSLALFACLICTTDNFETMQALRKLDASEELAHLRKTRLDQKEEQQRWLLRTAQSLDQALKESVPFRPDPLPQSWRRDLNMLALREQLVLVGHRLKSGQQAEFALNRLEQHAKQLQNRLREHRESGGRANEDTQRRIPFNEYLLIVDLQGPLGSVQAETIMSHFRHYLTMLAHEEEQSSRDIQSAVGEYVSGNTRIRINSARKSKRFGQIVSAVNFLLDHVQLPLSNTSSDGHG